MSCDWKRNPTTFSADTLKKKVTVDVRTFVPLPPRHWCTFPMRLCLLIQARRSLLWPSGPIFPSGPIMATMRLFHPPPLVSDTQLKLLPHSFGVQSCVLSLVPTVWSFFWFSLQRLIFRTPSLLPSAAFWIFLLVNWLLNRKPLWCCFLCICLSSLQYCPNSWDPWSSFLPFPSSGCLLLSPFYVTAPTPMLPVALWNSPIWPWVKYGWLVQSYSLKGHSPCFWIL